MSSKFTTAFALSICVFMATSNVSGYSISGYVKDGGLYDLGIEDVEVSIAGDWNGSVTTNGDGYYVKTGLAGGNYTLTASKVGYVFEPSSHDVTISDANVGGINFYTYTISGNVMRYGGAGPVAGVTINISGQGSVTTDVNGYYEKRNLASGTYTVEASSSVYVFDPARHVVELNWTEGNADNRNFTAFLPPQANFTTNPYPAVGVAPLTVSFTNTSTGDIVIHEWDFGDGNTSREENPPPHTYEDFGTYTVTLTVTGPAGVGSDTKTENIKVLARPIAVATADKEAANEGDIVTLDGSASYDPDGSIISYLWEQIEGPDVMLSDARAVSPTFEAPDVSGTRFATITLKLTVSDDNGLTDSDSVIITVTNLEPIYVDADANGNNDGTSWSNAYNYLQDALAEANSISAPIEIWVAEGIYNPDANSGYPEGTGERQATFQLISGVAVYGGFPLGGGEWEERDPEAYETIVSGDLDGNDVDVNNPCDLLTEPTRSENSYHVVTGGGTDETAVLNGFTITGGNANGTAQNIYGGGMYNSGGNPNPTVTNCTITGNSADYGGGIYNSDGPIINCTFSGNWAKYGGGLCCCDGLIIRCTITNNSALIGGGLYSCDGSITNCTISGNFADWYGGGLYYCDGYISKCTIIGNWSGESGGGLEWCNASVTNCTISSNHGKFGGGLRSCGGPITNCTITGNSAFSGGGLSNCDGPITNCTITGNSAIDYAGGGLFYCQGAIVNCIIWANASPTYPQLGYSSAPTHSCIQDWASGGSGNINAAPCFVDAGYWGDVNDANIVVEPNDPNAVWVDGDYHLLGDSPCIDAGDNNSVPADTADLDGDGDITEPTPFDLNGFPRLIDDLCTADTGNGTPRIVDMGAYEFLRSDIDSNGYVDFVDFAKFALHWTETGCGTCAGADLTCEGNVDFYDLKGFTDNWLAGVE